MRHYSRAEWARVFDNIVGSPLPGGTTQAVTARSAVQNYPLGARIELPLGRKFRYVQIGNGTYGPQGVAATQVRRAYGVINANEGTPTENTVLAAAVTLGQAAATITSIGAFPANHYAGGYIVNDGANYGFSMQILSHPASTGAGQAIVLTLADPAPIAMALGETVLLYHSEFSNVTSPRQAAIEALAATDTNYSSFIGVPLCDGLAGEFIWIQEKGPCFVVSASGTDGSVAVERTMLWNADGSVVPLSIAIGGVQSYQIAGYLIPVTQVAGVGTASPSALDYIYLTGKD